MANEKQMDSELIEELQQRLEALNNEGVMDAGLIDGFLTAYALNPEHPSKHDIYPYIFSEEGDPAALPEAVLIRASARSSLAPTRSSPTKRASKPSNPGPPASSSA